MQSTIHDRGQIIEPLNDAISVARQCELVGLSRSTLYYRPVGTNNETLGLMRRLDELYTLHPYYGVLRMTATLRREGNVVNEKRVRRLLRMMGLQALYPRRNLSKRHLGHKIFPYLLRGLHIENKDHAWSADITYIRMLHGFVYLVAIIDWYSRYVVDWQVSTILEADFCREALERSLDGRHPRIFNTDQGCQFTSPKFTGLLQAKEIRVSMDGRGRALDNVFVERLWRSLKQEKIYLNEFTSVKEAKKGIEEYFEFYNHKRLHQALHYRTPAEVYFA